MGDINEKQKRYLVLILIFLSIGYFYIFIFPNNAGAEDINMLSIFEPDEFAQYPYVMRMIEFKGDSIRHKLWNFIAYQHYYYGFPFYALSAFVLLPLKLFSSPENVQMNMLFLRQVVSILPMIGSIWILVYLQTRFKDSVQTLIIFIFLLSIPIVVRNNLWWHPDSLAILFSVLVFFFLDKDQLRYEGNFLFAAIAAGLSIGTKMIGWFFFLTIPIYLIWGIKQEKITWPTLIKKALLFLLVMSLTVVISNPALIHPYERGRYVAIQKAQSIAMGFGWDVAYEKGPGSWFDIILEYYGQLLFLLVAFVSLGIGIYKKKTRLFHVLILSWVLPMSLYILFFVAIKPKHLLLPIALPLFSGLANIIPSSKKTDKVNALNISAILLFILVLVQFGQNLIWDFSAYQNRLERPDTHPAIGFYNELDNQLLACLPEDKRVKIYRDVRVYIPPKPEWDVQMRWGVVDYEVIQSINPELVLLQQQRIMDYTQPDVIDNAEDKEQMKKTYKFYLDAYNKELEGYYYLLEDEFGIAFIRDDVSFFHTCE